VALVQPRRPQALSSVAKASGATTHLSACSSGENLMLALSSSGARVAKVTRALKARRSKCGYSPAPSNESAMRGNQRRWP